MAKKRIANGVIYHPHKKYPEGTCCKICNREVRSKIAYTSNKEKNDYMCFRCVNDIVTAYEAERVKNAPNYPKTTTLYVGKKNHICCETKSEYESLLFYFSNEKSKKSRVRLEIQKCKNCGIYIMRHNDYENHKDILSDYDVISTKTNKPFPVYKATGNLPFSNPQPPRPVEAPPYIQWAARHPFSGGGFTPK